MSDLATQVAELIPRVHERLRTNDDIRGFIAAEYLTLDHLVAPDEDLSRTARCDRLSYALLQILEAEGLPARRELHAHPYSNQWHFVIAHDMGEPGDTDTITDLNPWTFANTDKPLPSHLHGPRDQVIEAVRASGSHTVRAECLFVSTVAAPHVPELPHDIANYPGFFDVIDKGKTDFDFGFPDWRIAEE